MSKISTNPHFYFHPNFANAYGLATSDGYTNIIQKNYVEFWNYGILKKNFNLPESSIYFLIISSVFFSTLLAIGIIVFFKIRVFSKEI